MSSLVNRNVRKPDGNRTSIRLEPLFWMWMQHLLRHEEIDGRLLVQRAQLTYPGYGRTSAVRTYLLREALVRAGIIEKEAPQ